MTISAAKDANRIPVLLGTLNTDGQTVKPIGCNPTNHGLLTVCMVDQEVEQQHSMLNEMQIGIPLFGAYQALMGCNTSRNLV